MAIGAGASGATTVDIDLVTHQPIDWGQVGLNMLVGGTLGAGFSALGPVFNSAGSFARVARAGYGISTGFGSSVATDEANNKKVSWTEAILSGALGGAAGAVHMPSELEWTDPRFNTLSPAHTLRALGDGRDANFYVPRVNASQPWPTAPT